jgi:sorbitol/mannitol transport system substrate-binding protein
MLAAFALIAAACGSDAEELVDDATDAAEEVVDEAEDAMEDDEEAMEDDEEAMEDDEAMADDAMEFDGTELTVAIVGNGATNDIQTLTPEFFTTETGITVNFVQLEEQALREQVTLGVGTGGGQFDVVMIGPYEAPQFGQNGWLEDLTPRATADTEYNVDDLLPAIRGALSIDDSLYAVPFYGESSFIMYNQEIMDANGIDFPAAPTWQEVADIARQIDTDETAGICLRGLPGWGDLGASLTTVVNTFGGTWWEANADGTPGEAQINQADSGFREAFEFYVSLLNDAGQDDAANSSFPQCLDQLQNGNVAMWYDATVAAGILEGDDSPLQGNLGVALAPTVNTPGAGWLWTWAFAIPAGSNNPDAGWEFMSWATSEEYVRTAGENGPGGWAAAPPGSRTSTYGIPEYQEAASSFYELTLDQINAADPTNPGTSPRPGLPGVQYVGIPEFQDVGTRCTTEFSAAIAGSITVDEALDRCQEIASEVSQ